MNRPKAIKDYKGMCFKCLQKKDKINTYYLNRSEYGSSFDNIYTYLQICDDCKPEGIEEWFNEEPEMDDYYANYKYEKNILEFIKTLPLEGQELFWARCSHGANADYIAGQDWIDYQLDILPHEKCKEYGLYSPQEKKAYQERFPICKHVKIKIYKDGSKGCSCPFGAFGNKDGTAKGHQTQSECYECVNFELREGEIMTVDLKQEEIKRIKEQIKRLQKKLEELENI